MANQVFPIVQAVVSGALDSCENVLINISSKIPFLNSRNKELDACMAGKVCIVTGANAGIGYATAKKLAQRGAHVVLACRSEERGKQAAQELSSMSPLPGCPVGSVEYAQLDLCSMKNVKAFVKKFNSQGRPLDVLVCNAGIMSPANRLVSEDGLELQFQVNFLSHWLLAHELLAEQRRRRAKHAKHSSKSGTNTMLLSTSSTNSSSSSGKGVCDCNGAGTRLVMLSSLTHHAGTLKWDDKQSASSYSPFTSYALSKLCNTIMAAEFQRRFSRHDSCRYGHDSAVAIHPGIVHTHLATGFFHQTGSSALPWMQHVVRPLLDVLYPLVLRTPDNSADSMLLAAIAPAERVAGRYLHNDRLSRPNKFAEEPERGAELWDLAVQLTGVDTHSSLA